MSLLKYLYVTIVNQNGESSKSTKRKTTVLVIGLYELLDPAT
jgi:hypothetical protein